MYPIHSENSPSPQYSACAYSSEGYAATNQYMYSVNSAQYQSELIAHQCPEPAFMWDSDEYPYIPPLENVSNNINYEAPLFGVQIPNHAVTSYNNGIKNSEDYSTVNSGVSEQKIAVVPTRTKRNRTAFSSTQMIELERAFHYNRYLSGARRTELAVYLNFTERQVNVWFKNRRMKYKKENGKCSNLEIHSSPAVTSSNNSSPCSTGEISNRPGTAEPLPSHSAVVQNQYAAQSQSSNRNPQAIPQWNTSPGYSNQYMSPYASNDVAFQRNTQAAYVPPINTSSYNVENKNYTPATNMQREFVPQRQFNDNRYYSWDNCSSNN